MFQLKLFHLLWVEIIGADFSLGHFVKFAESFEQNW